MKLVVQNYRSGELSVIDVPPPACKPGGVLVASRYSLISVGTELMKVTEAKLSLLGKARARPDQVRKVVETVAQVGPTAAYQKAMSKLDSYTPLGYSLSGIVVDVGAGVHDFKVGQPVACAGNEHALHGELNWVPTNLCVPVPDGVHPKLAAFATVGAIAMQGVRRAEVQLGETACVIGLGLIGQLLVQLLVAAGVAVVGLDPVDDRSRMAESAGALACAPPTDDGIAKVERHLATASAGIGADHVFLAAGGDSNDPVNIASRLARDRGRVVDIGKCRLDLPWNDYYLKELDVRFSRSYGPGRYDPRYEVDGVDYPPGYVRWTERRNLACFLDLVSRGRLSIDPLVSALFPVTEAVSVYDQLSSGQLRGVGFLFEYPERALALTEPAQNGAAPTNPTPDQETSGLALEPAPAPEPKREPKRPASPAVRRPLVRGTTRLAFVGAGNYASSMLLPHVHGRDDIELVHVATTTSLSAVNAQRRFGFLHASTDLAPILDDDSISAVFIVTRHRSHANLVCQALERGKTVFVEKPLALSSEELDRVEATIGTTGNDRLMVGFNRRFAPLLTHLRSKFGRPAAPSVLRYLVNAGPIDAGSWYRDTEGEGSRFEGEGGHFIDTLSWWLDARPVEVSAVSTVVPDDLVANIRFDDHSVASLVYTTNGNRRYPKEIMEVAAGGRMARLDNFRHGTVWVGRRRSRRVATTIDKGQRQQLEEFLASVRSGGPMPIPLESLVATTRATLAVARSQVSGRPVAV
ncbi:MAG: bi-domain-containing oxidoreductase [Actinomycetota bacterium]|nr:bi-domain-containing oxidoreductase [Actinomycetota bacterium]MDQ6945033.1 bi-domain-containing oxidoreductase [Actinomycetota bacterium]